MSILDKIGIKRQFYAHIEQFSLTVKMPPFSPAQNASVPMKTRLKLKLAKIMQSEKNDSRRTKKRIEDGCEALSLRRSVSSPSLRSLNQTSWSKGRGKGGKKLGVGGGLVKSLPEQGFQEWTKIHKASTEKMIKKRKENSFNMSTGGSPALTKSKRVFGRK